MAMQTLITKGTLSATESWLLFLITLLYRHQNIFFSEITWNYRNSLSLTESNRQYNYIMKHLSPNMFCWHCHILYCITRLLQNVNKFQHRLNNILSTINYCEEQCIIWLFTLVDILFSLQFTPNTRLNMFFQSLYLHYKIYPLARSAVKKKTIKK